jgi:hypothetical protein
VARVEQSPETRLAEFVHNLDDDKLRCRARSGRHSEPDPLDPKKTHYKRQRGGTYLQEFVCESCGRVIVRLIAASGYLDDKVGYDRANYPDGYLLPKGILGANSDLTQKDVNAAMRKEARLRNMARARGARVGSGPNAPVIEFRSANSGSSA